MDLQVRGKNGDLVRLGSLLTAKMQIVPAALYTFQKQASVTLQGVLMPGVGLSKAVKFAQHQLSGLKAKGVTSDLSRTTRQSEETGKKLLFSFLIAILGVYCLLILQQGSHWDPLIIILGSVPFSTLGALVVLNIYDLPLDLFTQIGILTLIGLISKQGILVVQAANARYKQGVSTPYLAIIRGSSSRLRSIFLTTITMILGALPLLFATGSAEKSRYELGIVIVSGILVGSLMTLFIIPSLYIFV